MRHLNETHDLAEVGWDAPALPKLWRYNQHYFDDLQAEGWRERAPWHTALIGRWIDENPPGRGSGWEPYPVSLRIVNWVKWSLSGSTLEAAAIASLAVQARWLTRRLERHLLGNHLFANAKALIFVGCFFSGREADAWRATGLRILDRELDEQFLTDGAQFELSPMYHALAFEDLLDLLDLAGAFPGVLPEAMVERIARRAMGAATWLAAMSHPDDRISFFNDASFSIAPENAALHRHAAELGVRGRTEFPPLFAMPASGHVRMQAGPALLLADLARVGPDYLPGHAHADTLGFELSLFGRRVMVQSGTSEYGTGPERQRQRGTAAHNTVVVAGRDSSEVWGGFRTGRRARPRDVRFAATDDRLTAEAAHDGYAHLPGRPLHHRAFTLTADRLEIVDEVSAPLPAEARFHLHPDVRAVQVGEDRVDLLLPEGECVRVSTHGVAVTVVAGTWHPEFGRVLSSSCLVLPLAAGRARLSLTWG